MHLANTAMRGPKSRCRHRCPRSSTLPRRTRGARRKRRVYSVVVCVWVCAHPTRTPQAISTLHCRASPPLLLLLLYIMSSSTASLSFSWLADSDSSPCVGDCPLYPVVCRLCVRFSSAYRVYFLTGVYLFFLSDMSLSSAPTGPSCLIVFPPPFPFANVFLL